MEYWQSHKRIIQLIKLHKIHFTLDRKCQSRYNYLEFEIIFNKDD